MAVRIVTDSACDLAQAQVDQHGIEVVPLSIRFGDEEYVDRVELSVDDFYAKMAQTDTLPETAAPSPGAFEQAFRKLGTDRRRGRLRQSLRRAVGHHAVRRHRGQVPRGRGRGHGRGLPGPDHRLGQPRHRRRRGR